ncbi:probable methyltransferase-like protein 15 homolog [Nilaparvata lugens]|uniref:probable methyltransferase-like protein 15 homolog n=1 Tax=Nilaparvata lugens TaxID=108931 RepID=UPI00193EB66A|nr:probable methyltransferase-like protein 15 homolog [Nilaparvata lugens]
MPSVTYLYHSRLGSNFVCLKFIGHSLCVDSTNRVVRHLSNCIGNPFNVSARKFSNYKETPEALSARKLSETKEKPLHIPVMKEEVLENAGLNNESVFLDMTFGAGGHTQSILDKYSSSKAYCLDRDPVAYQMACDLQTKYPERVVPLLGKFSELPGLLKEQDARQNYFDAILFDFGCSSMQFDEGGRGFSVSKNGPLDMRMDGNRHPQNPTAADVLATADEHDLYKIFKVYGEEKKARKIARAVVEARYLFTPLQTTRELADLISSVLVNETRTDKLDRHTHVATKIFQALRIFVNNELNEINYGLLLAQRYLRIGGRLITICFHSLEDLIVKRHITGNMTDNEINMLPLQYVDNSRWHDRQSIDEFTSSHWQPLLKHVLVPSDYEVESNPRSRSAKMRAAVRVS